MGWVKNDAGWRVCETVYDLPFTSVKMDHASLPKAEGATENRRAIAWSRLNGPPLRPAVGGLVRSLVAHIPMSPVAFPRIMEAEAQNLAVWFWLSDIDSLLLPHEPGEQDGSIRELPARLELFRSALSMLCRTRHERLHAGGPEIARFEKADLRIFSGSHKAGRLFWITHCFYPSVH